MISFPWTTAAFRHQPWGLEMIWFSCEAWQTEWRTARLAERCENPTPAKKTWRSCQRWWTKTFFFNRKMNGPLWFPIHFPLALSIEPLFFLFTQSFERCKKTCYYCSFSSFFLLSGSGWIWWADPVMDPDVQPISWGMRTSGTLSLPCLVQHFTPSRAVTCVSIPADL